MTRAKSRVRRPYREGARSIDQPAADPTPAAVPGQLLASPQLALDAPEGDEDASGDFEDEGVFLGPSLDEEVRDIKPGRRLDGPLWPNRLKPDEGESFVHCPNPTG